MRYGIAGRIAAAFIQSRLTPLFIIASLLLGAFAILRTPREEEPQIKVPLIDIHYSLPGATAEEVERQISTPVEKWIYGIEGIDHVYSISSPGGAIITARFNVGANPHTSLVKLQEKLQHNAYLLPPDTAAPLIQEKSINDVPILALTLHSPRYSAYTLRRLAVRLDDAIRQVPNVAETEVLGGPPHEVRIEPVPSRLAAYHISLQQLAQALQTANASLQAGEVTTLNRSTAVRAGQFISDGAQAGNVVAGVWQGAPVYVRNVAKIIDGPATPASYVFFANGAADKKQHEPIEPAVTISVAKRAGTNAATVANAVVNKVNRYKGSLIPADVTVSVTRNYGITANEKAMELLEHMLIAVVSVTLLIAFALGRRESMVVAVAIPVTLALTLLMFYLYGYTLNRITLFALIFSIGILVDDAIVVVENIVRHYRMAQDKRSPLEAAIQAVDEVGNPTLLATFAVIAAILPMAFVGGLMGPYMRPIPVGASAAMIISVAAAFVVTPWAAFRLLRREYEESHHPHAAGEKHSHETAKPDWTTRLYVRIMTPLLEKTSVRMAFFTLVLLLLAGSVSLLFTKSVVVKMLPFDNKNEFQVVIDMNNDTTLEQTAAAARALDDYLNTVPEVKNTQIYVGTHSPINFNGLVRQYYLRSQPWQADIQVNLVGKDKRNLQSHDIVKRIRPALAQIAARWHVRMKVAEVPPGPPVLETLVAEVYGPTQKERTHIAREVKQVFAETPGVTDVDWYHDTWQPTVQYVPDRRKAALSGIDVQTVANTLAMAVSGETLGVVHNPQYRQQVPLRMRMPRALRSSLNGLGQIYLPAAHNTMTPLSELVDVKPISADRSRYHKDLMPVVYVTGDVTGKLESPVYAILAMNRKLARLVMPGGGKLNVLSIRPPFTDQKPAMKWDGEWQITYEVFRDLGIAFAVVLVLIYILVVGWFKSFTTPLVIMAPIPLTLVGILPAHALLGAYFTATSMIGFIAGAGIIVRNSIILVDFIELRLKQGMGLEQAVIDAGATRFRPMLLTAAAVIVGSSVILFDPIFQGLAISLMAGEIASTLLSRLAVPVLYFLMRKRSGMPVSAETPPPPAAEPELMEVY